MTLWGANLTDYSVITPPPTKSFNTPVDVICALHFYSVEGRIEDITGV